MIVYLGMIVYLHIEHAFKCFQVPGLLVAPGSTPGRAASRSKPRVRDLESG